jgi:hypothetical protein
VGRSLILLPCLCVAFVLVMAAGAANPADKLLAEKLVLANGEYPGGNFWYRAGGKPPGCLSKRAFAITGRAARHVVEPNNSVDSVATVFETRAEASRYYHVLVSSLSGCLRRYWRHVSPRPSWVGTARVLPYPRFGWVSAAARLPLGFRRAFPTWHERVDDWIVARERRAVVVDDWFLMTRWGAQAIEQPTMQLQLARAFGG